MKKILVVLSCLVLVLSLSVLSVSAATDGYDFVSTASQVSVNGSIVGEGVVIITESDNIPTANLRWAISVVLDLTDGGTGVYMVAFVHNGDGNDPAITLEEGQILLGVHSASSDPSFIDQYQNVNGKLAAQALEQGDTIAFTGIDFETGTVSDDATIIAGGTGSVVEESDPEEESVPATESAPADDESTPADTSVPADTSAEVSEGDNEGGNNTWIYIVCAIAAVLIVAVVVVMVKKK